MATILKDSSSRGIKAPEKGTLKVSLAFTDEDGTAVAPETLTWTLTDDAGNVINEREDESISSPEATEILILTGDDLEITATENLSRHLLFENCCHKRRR